jgi:hypothetical protein
MEVITFGGGTTVLNLVKPIVSMVLALALAGCGGSGEVIGGSPRLAPGTYKGAENWSSGIAAGTRIPLVAVVTAGNNFAYSDVGAPGPLPYNGTAVLPIVADAEGRFTIQVAQGTFAVGFIAAGTIEGRNRPDAEPQLSGTIHLQSGDDATFSLTRQAGQGHPLEGFYLGTFSAPESGPAILMVGADGLAILLRGPAGRWVETAVGSAEAGGTLVFDKVNPGTALAGAVAGDTALGTYTFPDVGSGTWAAVRQ